MADQIIIEYGAKIDKLEADLRKLEDRLRATEKAGNDSAKGIGDGYTKQGGIINRLRDNIQKLTEARDRSNNPKLLDLYNQKIDAANAKLRRLTGETTALGDAQKKVNKEVKKVNKEVNGLDKRLNKIAASVAGLFAVNSLISYGKQVVEITAKFQKFESVLTNTLGSRSAAQQALELIKKFAAETPFAVDELTASYVKLVNQGFKPTEDEMRKLGDLASSQGKSFDMLTEAIIDAQTGEFERLKEFGIRASKEGDKVKFTFKGVQTQTDFTAASIRKYILSLGDLEGVSGGMSAISKTLGGQLSNLGDTFDSLLLSIGAMTSGTVSGFISIIGRAAESLRDFITPTVDVKEQLALTRIEFNKEIEVLKSANYSQEQRARAIREINEKYKDYLPNLISETASLQEIEKAQKGVNDAITERILMTAFEEEITELIKVQKSAAESLYKTEKARAQQKKETNAIDLRQIEVQTKQFKNLDEINKAVIESSTKQIDEIDEKYQALAESLGVSWAKIRQQIEDAKKVTEIQGPKFSEKEIAEYNKAMARAAKISEIIASRQTDFRAKTEADFTEIQKKEEKKRHASRLKDMKAFQKEYLDPMVQASKEASDKQLKIDVERIHAQRKLRMSLLMQGIETLGDTLNTIREMEQQNIKAEIDAEIEKERTKTDNQLANLDKRREAGIISETQYEAQKERIQQTAKKKENDLRRKQFEAEKKSAITRVNIETAVAIAKTIATMGFLPALPFIPFVLAQGELQKVTIRNQKFTGYKDGVIDLQGKGTGTSDSIPAKLSKGESVMTAEETKEFKPLFTAIRKNKFDEYINKNYLEPIKKKAEEKQREAVRRSENMEGLMKEMVLNSFDTSHLERLTKKNKSVKIENVKDLGKEIGKYVKPQSSRGL